MCEFSRCKYFLAEILMEPSQLPPPPPCDILANVTSTLKKGKELLNDYFCFDGSYPSTLKGKESRNGCFCYVVPEALL